MVRDVRRLSILLATIASLVPGKAPAAELILEGISNDPRISTCGIRLIEEGTVQVLPFLETSEAVAGRYRLKILKRSPGGHAEIVQEGSIGEIRMGQSRLFVDRPASLRLELEVRDEKEREACRLTEERKFPLQGFRI